MNFPYTIEIVPVDRGWILETIARAIESEAALSPGRFNVRIVDQPSDDAELTFFLPESAYRSLNNSITVTYLAHKEDHPGAAHLFEEVARQSDYCITSSTKYQRILEQDGAKKVFKIHLGVDTELFTPRLRLGVVGRTYHTGRKGEALLAELAGLSGVELRFTGEGWPHPAGYYATDDLVDFYRDIDYLLIPSLIEGGPVPMLEALSAGCPVIAPSDIGLVEDFPHVPFKRGDGLDLRRVVEGLLHEKLSLRKSVIGCDWREFARQHLDLFAELIDARRQTKPAPAAATPAHVERPVRALLVTHGTENAAKGGPSTRVRFIVSQLQAARHKVETRHNIRSVSDVADFDVVHVFNSWPPQTALECMAIAKQAGKAVAFSPIALDLVDWPVYRQLMEYTFATRKRSSIESVVAQLPQLAPLRRYVGEHADVPLEGIPGHFESLRQCCALADYVVFLSDLERNFLAAVDARTDHGVLIRNGVSDAFSGNAAPDLFRKHIGFERYVLCVGRIEYRKNQALLAMAMRDLDVPLVLIGDEGDPGYLGYVQQMGGSNLRHISRIEDKAMLASAYAGATVFVLPSWCEGAPLAALEAGLTGVPLVLSDRASEREYFGIYADYISPAEPSSMRAAIQRALAKRESQDERAERAAFLRARYSETEHVRNTLQLYRDVSAAPSVKREEGMLIDVSSLVHSLRIGGHLTGIPLVERNLVAEIVAINPSARCITYNDIQDSFIEIDYRDLESFDAESFQRRYWANGNETNARVDIRRQLVFANVSAPPLIPTMSTPMSSTNWQHYSIRIANALARLGFSPRMIGRIGRVAKRFRRLLAPALQPATNANIVTSAIAANADLSDVGRYLTSIKVPRPTLDLVPGSRILTLGQGWLSNEPLLDRLIELSAGHNLEAYVYDISYVSGAHFSGWSDNGDRQRRLSKLLKHCRTVFTESRITETELAKFASSRSLSFRIVRTGLKGKECAPSKMKVLPRRNEPFVLYVSSFNRRKNHDFIVEVWKDMMSVPRSVVAALGIKLLLVGEIQGEAKYGDPEYREHLKHLNIEVINNADDEQLSEYYHRCLFTLFPSLQEGWGIPVQESLIHGKLCLASNTVPAAREISNAALIKLVPNDFFSWREAISTWAENDEMRAAFEAKALEYAAPTWREIALSILTRKSIKESAT